MTVRIVLALLFALAGLSVSRADDAPHRTLEITWKATLPDDSPGYGVALLPDKSTAAPTDWVEPSLPGVFAVGFDTLNPPTKNPFNADGNINNQPQREISLHWNGIEVANRLCPEELKGKDGHSVTLSVAAAVGGSEVTVAVGKTKVYDHYFVPEFFPYAMHTASGGAATLADLKTKWSGLTFSAPAAPVHVRAFDRVTNDKDHHRNTAEVAFPETTKGIGRVVCTLTLADTPNGLDPWDRIAQIFLYDEKGERFELLRYITPYRKGWTWKVDVTDLMPLLTGKKKMEVFCETYAAGWLVSVDFDFYPGPIAKVPYKVVNLWNVVADIGQESKPFDKSVPPKSVEIDKDAKQVKVRFCVTGHGQAPNTDNAAEFISLWRKLYVGDAVFQNTLWKEDNYLNPCRPQGGTWKYSRAGWAPGDVVTPWLVDITKNVKRGQPANLRYEIQPFVNKTPDGGNPARHIIESQVIYYR